MKRVLFIACALAMLLPGVSPAIALALGAVIALTVGNPWPVLSSRGAPLLLKTCVIGLGFGMSLDMLVQAGAAGVVATTMVVLGTLAGGIWLGRFLGVPGETALLIASGTGVCGGSAIAAVGSALDARAESMSVALATVFLLNAVALYVFPLAGTGVGLTEEQFGAWAALAIHDTSSVVGAASVYGPTALAVATVMKLVRALWIMPLVLVAVLWRQHNAASGESHANRGWRTALGSIPWFIVLFVLAVVMRTVLPPAADPWLDAAARAARAGLVLTLFLIGAGLTRATLARVGGRPFLQGVLLWLGVASLSLLAIMRWAPG